jgi:outer membrane protein, heavy metal efflux system
MLTFRSAAAAIALLLPAAAPAAPASDAPTLNQQPAAAAPSVLAATPPADVAFGQTLERAELVGAVLARNPSLEAARQAHRAALERPVQARSLMDPQLRYGVAPLSVGGSVPFGQTVEVEQMFPYPGTRRLRGEAAQAEARMAGLEIEALRLELALATSQLYDDYVLVARRLEVNAEHRRLMAGFQEIATARYAAGLLPQQAPLQAEVEIARLDRERLAYEREGQNLAARLNRLLHRPSGASLPPPPATGDPVPAIALAAPEAWEERALAARPELAAAAAEVEALVAGVELARLARRPDFGVMGSYTSMFMDTEHQWMAGVSINLPVRRQRLRAAEAEAEARVDAAEARRLALVDAIRSEVREAWDGLSEVDQVVDLYASRLLPASRDQVQAALSAVETGRTSFLDLIEAERNLRDVELGYQETLAERERRRAELQRQAGELPGAPPGTAGQEPGSPAALDDSRSLSAFPGDSP